MGEGISLWESYSTDGGVLRVGPECDGPNPTLNYAAPQGSLIPDCPRERGSRQTPGHASGRGQGRAMSSRIPVDAAKIADFCRRNHVRRLIQKEMGEK